MSLLVDIEKKLGAFTLHAQFETSGGIMALLGASGSGKSVTLKCIAGIMTPDRGRIVLDGKTLFDSEARVNLTPQQRRVGYLFQQYALFPNMTVMQNILCGVRSGTRANAAGRCRTACAASVWKDWRKSIPRSSPAASSSASRWHEFWFPNRGPFCSTSRFPRWTAS